jgi:hypothetical protein
MFFHSSWKTFRSQFGSTLRNLKKYRDLLSDEKITATILEVQELRQSMESKLSELSRRLEYLQLADEESSVLEKNEEAVKKRSFVLAKLGAGDYAYDLEKASAERRCSPSGDWILEEPVFLEWLNTTSADRQILHVHGSPGTGQ